jgi:hypothetical protein
MKIQILKAVLKAVGAASVFALAVTEVYVVINR